MYIYIQRTCIEKVNNKYDIYTYMHIYICLLNKYSKYIYIHTIYIYMCVYMYSFQVKYTIEKMFWPVTGHPGLAPDISRQVPDIPGVGHPRCRTSQVPDIPGAGHPGLAPDISRQVQDIPALHRTSQGRCRTSQVSDIPGAGHCTGHLKAGAGHPGLAPDISRQVPDIPALRRTAQGRFWTSQGRCRTSRPCAGHLKAGAGHLKTGTGHPGQALNFLMNSIKDHKSSPRSKSLTLPVANWPTECLRTKPSTLLGSHSFLLLSKVSFSSS